MDTELLIVGSGGFARETAAAVHAANRLRPGVRLLGYLDDDVTLHGRLRAGVPVLGGLDLVHELSGSSVVVCVGNPRDTGARRRVVRRLGLADSRYTTVLHPSAAIAPGCEIGPGSVVLAHVTFTADVTVGAHVAIMPSVVLTHDTLVEDFVTLASGVKLGGGVRLEQAAYLGAGALIRESVTVGAGALVGMGSVVLRDVPPGQVWAGNPARYLRDVNNVSTSTSGADT